MFKRMIGFFVKEKSPKQKYLEKHGSTSCCPKCKKWEHEGNVIFTRPSEPDDGSDVRECKNCNHTWVAIFTPAGFVPVAECKKISK